MKSVLGVSVKTLNRIYLFSFPILGVLLFFVGKSTPEFAENSWMAFPAAAGILITMWLVQHFAFKFLDKLFASRNPVAKMLALLIKNICSAFALTAFAVPLGLLGAKYLEGQTFNDGSIVAISKISFCFVFVYLMVIPKIREHTKAKRYFAGIAYAMLCAVVLLAVCFILIPDGYNAFAVILLLASLFAIVVFLYVVYCIYLKISS